MRDPDELFAALSRSKFRGRQRLNDKDRAYLVDRSLPVVLDHARDFITQRLAPAAAAKARHSIRRLRHPREGAQSYRLFTAALESRRKGTVVLV